MNNLLDEVNDTVDQMAYGCLVLVVGFLMLLLLAGLAYELLPILK